MAIKGPFKMNISLIEEAGIFSYRNQTNFIISLNIFSNGGRKKPNSLLKRVSLICKHC